ncbi:MAG: NAD(P)/FAD-dependent oxidoreductase [Hymenobacter sp.]|nr:MAG: NAD(P)/FAD-dependent oxidoreductase [Hymenobacter sp.]
MPGMDFSHVVVGGGAIGLAIASRLVTPTLTSSAARNVLMIERNRHVGMETSARNSEVIHAGLYYPLDSLKTELCIKGKHMLYDLFERQNIPYRKTGKWIVAQNAQEAEYLQGLKSKADGLDVPVKYLSSAEANRLEPHIRADECVLESTSTGIMDSHSLMQYLLHKFESDGGDVSLGTSITDIQQIPGGYKLITESESSSEPFEITTSCVINSSGLAAVKIANMILPETAKVKGYYAKGQYYSYTGHPRPSRLIYPCPAPDLAGLGTHLTLDLAGQIRFGPDIEWIEDPSDYSTSDTRLEEVYQAVKLFYPSLDRARLGVDYCGIRPKMTPQGASASDFMIRDEESNGLPGFINLLGIESPGLTSCLSLAEHVEKMARIA